jgi:hypothetical protein
MQFVIDESSWRFTGLVPSECIEALESMLDQLDDIQAAGHLLRYSDELFNIPVWDDKSFYDLYSPDCALSIPRQVQERIGSTFSGLLKWQEIDSDWPNSFEMQVGNAPIESAPSVAWAHKQTIDDATHPVACSVFPGGRVSGLFPVAVDGKTTLLWFVEDKGGYCSLFRWLIVSTTKNQAEMERIALSAFPLLDFVDGAFDGIKDMKKPYQDLVEALVHHLGVLSDHGLRIFKGRRQRVAAEFGAFGVDISDENGNTKADRLARKERTVEVDGIATVFWWHTKLEPHQNRIHLNPDRVANGGRLLVGIFCGHLKT